MVKYKVDNDGRCIRVGDIVMLTSKAFNIGEVPILYRVIHVQVRGDNDISPTPGLCERWYNVEPIDHAGQTLWCREDGVVKVTKNEEDINMVKFKVNDKVVLVKGGIKDAVYTVSVTKLDEHFRAAYDIFTVINDMHYELSNISEDMLKAAVEPYEGLMEFEAGSEHWIVDETGRVMHGTSLYEDADDTYARMCNRYFKTEAIARQFKNATQPIADMLRFKYEKDREFVPTNKNPGYLAKPCVVAFSTNELAEECADWMNSIYDENGERIL